MPKGFPDHLEVAYNNGPYKLSKGQRQGQLKKVHQMKMLHENRATHAVILDAEFDGDIHLKITLTKGQCQVKVGQIRSHFQILNFLTGVYLSYPVLSQDAKNVIYCY